METHKERLETLEIHVSNIQEVMAKMFAEIQKLLESLNNHSPGIEGKFQLGEKRGGRRGAKEMVLMKLQKRLPIDVLKNGRDKVWLDPNKVNEISKANSRQNIRKLVKYVFVTRKQTKIHSRSHACPMKGAKRKDHHYGYIKRKGTTKVTLLNKILWMRRIHVPKSFLHKYKELKKIDKNKVRVIQFPS